MRISWDNYFIEMTKLVSQRSGCNKRHVGAVIVKDNRVLATGYNSAPYGVKECCDKGHCLRSGSKQGENLGTCMAVHAEMNAILQCAKLGISCENAKIYITTHPCIHCLKAIINAGIKEVIYIDDYNDPISKQLAEECDIKIKQYKENNKDEGI